MKTLPYCAVLLGSLLLAGCAEALGEGPYRAYLQDASHGLTQTHEVGAATVTCAYRPLDLLVAQELAGQEAAPPQVVDSLRRSYAGKTYFSLALSQKGSEIENQLITDQGAFTQAIAYLSAGIAQDVYLATSAPQADSVAALTALYPRQYGNTGRSTVLLLFDTRRLNLSRGFTLTYYDTHFQLGTQRFFFSAADLARLPALQF